MGKSCAKVDQGIGLTVLSAGDVDGLFTVSVTGLTATLTITIPGGGFYEYRVWLSDSATDATQTADAIGAFYQGVTNSSGIAVIEIRNTGASDSWYPWGVFAKANVGGIITVGV